MIAFTLVIDDVTVDLFKDESIFIQKQVKDVTDMREVKTDFTQQFVLPASNTNNEVFDNWFDEDLELTTWNPHLKLDAEIRVHSIPIFTGCVELIGMKKKDGLPFSYKVVFYGQVKNILTEFGEQTMIDVDWSAYDHTVNYTNLIASWDGTLLSGDILYPVADYYTGFVWSQFYLPNNIRHSGSGIAINDTRPWIRLKAMIEHLFSEVGYSVQTGGLLDESHFDDLYCCPMGQAGPLQDPADEDAKFEVNAGAGPIVLAKTTPGIASKVPLNTTVSDPLSLFDTVNYEYAAPFNGEYEFTVDVDVASLAGVAPIFILGVFVNRNLVNLFLPTITASGVSSYTSKINIQNGDIVTLEYFATSGAITCNSIDFECTKVPFGIDGKTLDMAITMPDVKVTDFIQSFLRTFNAVVYAIDDSTVGIENLSDWFANGTQRNYTKYIDTKDIEMDKLPIPRRVNLTHQQGKDLANKAFESLNNRRFGEVRFDPNVDYADSELKVETLFNIMTPTIMREINDKGEILSDTDLQFMYFLDDNGKAVQHNFTLAYYVTKKAISYGYYWGGAFQTNIPIMSAFNADTTTASTDSLGFGVESSLSGDIPMQTLYAKYYQPTLERLYSTNSRMITMNAVIPVGEWLKLKLNDTLAISSNYYNIKSIKYDILSEKAVLELITYPDVNLTTWSSTGRLPSWTGGVDKPREGGGMLDGFVPRSIVNGREDGGTVYNTLNNQVTYDLTLLNLRQQMYSANIRVQYMYAYDDTNQVVALTGTAVKVPLSTSIRMGDTNRFSFDNLNDELSDPYGGQFKVTADVSFEQDTGARDIEFYIAIQGQKTIAVARSYGDSSPIHIEGTFTIGANEVVAIYVVDLNAESWNIDINYAALKMELQ